MQTIPRHSQFSLRHLAVDGMYVAAFNVLCAVLITYVFGGGRQFGRNLLTSMCIGTATWLLIDVARFMFRRQKNFNWLFFLPVMAVGVFSGVFLGSQLAAWLLGIETDILRYFGGERGISALLFTVFATGAATLFFASRERLSKARAEAAMEKARAEAVERQALQAQLQLLQAQIEPHMLFNTLANLQGLIALDPSRAQTMLDQLIIYLRATLSAARAERTTLGQEFALLEAYLGLMSVRMGARLSFALELPDALRNTELPPMLLQPLVENAIAHGVEPNVNGGHIQVAARALDGGLELLVSDSGRGLDAGPGKPGTGLGLANVRERIAALYGEHASLSLEAAPQGATARIYLP
ncbi:sensor histidine kinase [Pseudoduganella violaceinigra]|uniref:sensor histidine kinase n=1 Tax=Pseudoduganella violaceinigra TaxID=246602 RepID=UPI00048270CA|nr:histidine kinase [Pseudoduganella violaceinigra]